jgi:hypothetical protein
MRATQLADIEAAARVLMRCRPSLRSDMAAQLVAQAHIADKYRKRLHKPHPEFGTGTLMSAASGYPQSPRLAWVDDQVLDALGAIITALGARKQHQIA